MRDMIPRGDRSIRNIPVSASHKSGRMAPPRSYDEDEDVDVEPPRRRPRPPRRRGWRPWWLLLAVVVVCAVAGLLLSTVFEASTVTVYPKTAAVVVPQMLTAQPGAGGMLSYQTMTISQAATTTVNAGGTQHVSRPATGVVTIFNAYSTAPQKLIANTRLTDQNNRIYRIKDAIVVPGATKTSGGTLTPGSVTVSIFADAAGPDYNHADSVRLNIAGFKGDPRYSAFYAQSQGPISGGFVGDEPAVAPVDMQTAQDTLKRQLDSNIRAVTTTNIPPGFIAVNGSFSVTYTDITQTPGPNNTVVLSQDATANMAIVRESDLAAAVAKQAVPDYSAGPIDFADMTKVDVSIATGSTSTATGPLNLTIGGTPTMVWQFDQQALKQALLGKKKAQFNDIITTFEPAIAKAQASVRPFWKATFPTDPARLTIKIVTP